MKSKVLGVHAILGITVMGAQRCQTSWQFRSGVAALLRKILFLTCVLGISCASWSQTDRASWANLKGLQAGQTIKSST
jgi:hypothetical protein